MAFNCPPPPLFPNCAPVCIKKRDEYILIEHHPTYFPEDKFVLGKTITQSPCGNLNPFWRPNQYIDNTGAVYAVNDDNWLEIQNFLLRCNPDCCDEDCDVQRDLCEDLVIGYQGAPGKWSECKDKCIIELPGNNAWQNIPGKTCGENQVWLENVLFDRSFNEMALVCGCACIDNYTIREISDGYYRLLLGSNFNELKNNCKSQGYDTFKATRNDWQPIDDSCGDCRCEGFRDYASFDTVNGKKNYCAELTQGVCCGILKEDTDRVYDCYNDIEEYRCVGDFYPGMVCSDQEIRSANGTDVLGRSPSDPGIYTNTYPAILTNNTCCDASTAPSVESLLVEKYGIDWSNNHNRDDYIATAFKCINDPSINQENGKCVWCLARKDNAFSDYLEPVFDPVNCKCIDECDAEALDTLPVCEDTRTRINPKGIRDKDTCECCEPQDDGSTTVWHSCSQDTVDPNSDIIQTYGVHPEILRKRDLEISPITGFCDDECGVASDLDDFRVDGNSEWNPDICRCECTPDGGNNVCEEKFGFGFVLDDHYKPNENFDTGSCRCVCDREKMTEYCQSKGLNFVFDKNILRPPLPPRFVTCGCECTEETYTALSNCPEDARNDRFCECNCDLVKDVLGNPKYPLKPGHVYNEYCESVCLASKELGLRPPNTPPCPDYEDIETGTIQQGWFADSSIVYVVGELAGLGNCACKYCPPGKKPYFCYSNETRIVQIGGTEQFPINYNAPVVYVSCVEDPCGPPRVVTECGHPIYKNTRVCDCEPMNGQTRIYNSETNKCECGRNYDISPFDLIPEGDPNGYPNCNKIYELQSPVLEWNNETCECDCIPEVGGDAAFCKEQKTSSHHHWKRNPVLKWNGQSIPIGSPTPNLNIYKNYTIECECVCDLKDSDCPYGYKANSTTCECEFEGWICGGVPTQDQTLDPCVCYKLTTPITSAQQGDRIVFDNKQDCEDRCCKGACCYRIGYRSDSFLDNPNEIWFTENQCELLSSETECMGAARGWYTDYNFIQGPYIFYPNQTCEDINCDIDIDSSSSSSTSSTSEDSDFCDTSEWKYVVYVDENNDLVTKTITDPDELETLNIFAIFKQAAIRNRMINILQKAFIRMKRLKKHVSTDVVGQWIPIKCDSIGSYIITENREIEPNQLINVYAAEFDNIWAFRPDSIDPKLNYLARNNKNILHFLYDTWFYYFRLDDPRPGFQSLPYAEVVAKSQDISLDTTDKISRCVSKMREVIGIIPEIAYNLLTQDRNFANSLCFDDDSSSSSSSSSESSNSSTSSESSNSSTSSESSNSSTSSESSNSSTSSESSNSSTSSESSNSSSSSSEDSVSSSSEDCGTYLSWRIVDQASYVYALGAISQNRQLIDLPNPFKPLFWNSTGNKIYKLQANCNGSWHDLETWESSIQLCDSTIDTYSFNSAPWQPQGDCAGPDCEALTIGTNGDGQEWRDPQPGAAFKFTGSVDGEWTNLNNWQDSEGLSPAASLPNANSVVEIAGAVTSIASDTYYTSVKEITVLSTGSIGTLALETEKLTVYGSINNGGICDTESGADYGHINVTGSAVDSCVFDGGNINYGKVTAPNTTVIFKNNSTITGDVGSISGDCLITTAPVISCSAAGIILESGSINSGYIQAQTSTGIVFKTGTTNNGTVEGNTTFEGTSNNSGTGVVFFGWAKFYGTANNSGWILGSAEFRDNSTNSGRIGCTFNDDSTEVAKFYDTSHTTGTTSDIDGKAIFYDSSYSSGTGEFRWVEYYDTSYNTGTVRSDSNVFFNEDSYNEGTITGEQSNPAECSFFGDSINKSTGIVSSRNSLSIEGKNQGSITITDAENTMFLYIKGNGINDTTGTITANTIFENVDGNIPRNKGTITGTADFTSGGCNDGGTATTFIPNPPPSC